MIYVWAIGEMCAYPFSKAHFPLADLEVLSADRSSNRQVIGRERHNTHTTQSVLTKWCVVAFPDDYLPIG